MDEKKVTFRSGGKALRTFPSLRPTAYSVFCKEYSKDHPGFDPSGWKKEWEALGNDGKRKYSEMAKNSELSTDEKGRKKLIKSLLVQLEWTSRQLDKIGISNFTILVDKESVHTIGSKQAKEFLDHTDIPTKYSRYCDEGPESLESSPSTTIPYATSPDPILSGKKNVEELRKKVQAHLNDLYKKATGKATAFPYKKVKNGEVIVEGIPEEVLPLHPPSHYGAEKLRLLLTTTSLTVSFVEPLDGVIAPSYEEDEDHIADADREFSPARLSSVILPSSSLSIKDPITRKKR